METDITCRCNPPQAPRPFTLCERCGRLIEFDFVKYTPGMLTFLSDSSEYTEQPPQSPAHRMRDEILRAERKKVVSGA